MVRLFLTLALAGVAFLALARGPREWLAQQAKDGSDVVISFLLRATSQFESELTADERAEQQRRQEERLRELRGIGREGMA